MCGLLLRTLTLFKTNGSVPLFTLMLKGLLRAFVDVPIENDARFGTGFDLLALTL